MPHLKFILVNRFIKYSCLLVSLLLLITSCVFGGSTENNDSPKANLSEKLVIKENGLTVKNIEVNDGNKKITSSKIVYGTKLVFEFNEATGFTEDNETVYPGLEIIVFNKNKDTIVYNSDLYSEAKDGIHVSELEMYASATLADPIIAGNDYSIQLHLWDKKGTGTLDTSFDFSLASNEKIKIEQNDFDYGEVYLLSDKRGVITDNQIVLNENVHIVFDDLDGFKIVGGKVSIGASIEVRNSFGIKIMEKEDVFKGQSILPVESLKEGIAPYIFFNEKDNEDPMKFKCRVKVWDKRSDKSITISAKLVLVDELEW